MSHTDSLTSIQKQAHTLTTVGTRDVALGEAERARFFVVHFACVRVCTERESLLQTFAFERARLM